MLKKSVLFVRRSSLVSRRSQAETFIPCEIRFTRDASRDTVFSLADFFSILALYEQQACGANLLPGGSPDEDLKLLYGSWKCGFRFPEQGVGTRWVVLGCGSPNQIVKPLSLLVGECHGMVVDTPRQNESRPSSDRFTDRLPT